MRRRRGCRGVVRGRAGRGRAFALRLCGVVELELELLLGRVATGSGAVLGRKAGVFEQLLRQGLAGDRRDDHKTAGRTHRATQGVEIVDPREESSPRRAGHRPSVTAKGAGGSARHQWCGAVIEARMHALTRLRSELE